ncbi:hypothetical protein [Dyadobacter pollutisoli]|uniref:Uncharacterized protein n=1 Tax=Dyadobacter pollutisoli TaxID=2910158 RepID=A0A9E8NFU3_9BACT|nr:hypothetical protein [Dyadobacter pollutisoli]WAC15158.1 hypothetical protein ON006_14555 [Dyadobacter pollutisoli]
MEIGTIKAVHIYIHEQLYVTAELELNLKGINHSFGGHKIFMSGMNGGESCDAPYLGRFLFRCMQICEVDSWEKLKSNKVLIEISNGKVTAIGNVAGSKWFNPRKEFEAMEQERDSSDVFNSGFKSSR